MKSLYNKIHGSHGDGMNLNICGGTPNTKYKVRSFQGSSFELSIGSSVLCIQVARWIEDGVWTVCVIYIYKISGLDWMSSSRNF